MWPIACKQEKVEVDLMKRQKEYVKIVSPFKLKYSDNRIRRSLRTHLETMTWRLLTVTMVDQKQLQRCPITYDQESP